MDKLRFGFPFELDPFDPELWARQARSYGLGAVYAPLQPGAAPDLIQSVQQAAQQQNLVIAEVGAWSNPASPDTQQRQAAIRKCIDSLQLAEDLGARCCLNISGSRSDAWDGPHAENFSKATFDLVVQTTRAIIDAVRPARTFFALETMPWMIPDSLEVYQRLIKAIDRTGFAVHLDPVNLITSPRLYYQNADLIRQAFRLFGSQIRSCHVKDVRLKPGFPVCLEETAPGKGNLDYAAFFAALRQTDPEIPVMLEHLPSLQAYQSALQHLKGFCS